MIDSFVLTLYFASSLFPHSGIKRAANWLNTNDYQLAVIYLSHKKGY